MKENQDSIYYITGSSIESVASSSFVSGVVNKGYDVLFMTDPIDEYTIQHLQEYDSKKLVSITKEGFVLPKDNDEEKQFESLKEDYKDTCEKIHKILQNKCEKVLLTNRLNDSPCCIVTGQFGWSANMERIMSAQALGNNTEMSYMKSKKILELNPNHLIIKELKTKLENPTELEDKINTNIIHLMFDTSLIDSGFTLDTSNLFSQRIYNMVQMGLGIEQPIVEKNKNISTDTDNIKCGDNSCNISCKENLSCNNVDEEMESVD